MSYNREEEVFEYLALLVKELEKVRTGNNLENYTAFLHGQIHGLAMSLRLLYPGPGNWGEKAALLVRPVITEHRCNCDERDD
jgi:LAO/AO transport system kinase